jgi:hypothetical protein
MIHRQPRHRRSRHGTHELPVTAGLRKAIGKDAGDTVLVRLEERIG